MRCHDSRHRGNAPGSKPALLFIGIMLAGTASAQTDPTPTTVSASDYSLIPYTQRGYVGLSLGRADYNNSCGLPLFDCEDGADYVAFYTGGFFTDVLGLEIGGKHFGHADRAGGHTNAYGATLSLVARTNLEYVNFYAKLGTIYGHTRVSADPLSGIGGGTDTGWGSTATLGIGYSWDRIGLALELSRDRLTYAGTGRSSVDSASVALSYRY